MGYPRYRFGGFKPVAGAPAKVPLAMYTAEQVWAAAVAAQRVNGEYLKEQEMFYQDSTGAPYDPPRVGRQANKHLMRDLLAGNSKHSITAQDIQDGADCRAHYQGLLFKELSGKLTSGFLKAVFALSNKDEFASNAYVELAQIAASPSGWKRDVVRDKVLEKAADGEYMGKPGDKVEGEVEITACNFSQQYGIYFASGFIGGNHVFFAYKNSLAVGSKHRVRGTVKAHRDNNTTQLNRVKVL